MIKISIKNNTTLNIILNLPSVTKRKKEKKKKKEKKRKEKNFKG